MGVLDHKKLQELKEMGFSEDLILQAMNKLTSFSSKQAIIEKIFELQTQTTRTSDKPKENQSVGTTLPTTSTTKSTSTSTSTSTNTSTTPKKTFDSDIEKAIQLSLETSKLENNQPAEDYSMFQFYEPQNPHFRKRKEGSFSGLQNISNTHYINSLLQSYFFIPALREKLFQFQPSVIETFISNQNEQIQKKNFQLVSQLQQLFSEMVISNCKYSNPLPVLKLVIRNEIKKILQKEQKINISLFHNSLCEYLNQPFDSLDNTKQEKERKENEEKKEEKEKEGEEKEKKDKKEKEIEKEKEMDLSNSKREEMEIEDPNKEQNKLEQKKSLPFISDLFFFDLKIVKYGNDENSNEVIIQKDKKTPSINLQINHGDLYSSLENYSIQIKNNFQSTQTKEVMFKRAPQVLTFQLDRIIKEKIIECEDNQKKEKEISNQNVKESEKEKNKENDNDRKNQNENTILKNSNQFTFEKEIYLDRYMHYNLNKTRKSREELKRVQQKKDRILNKLNKFQNFEQSSFPIDLSLKNTLDYLKTSNSNGNDKNTENGNQEQMSIVYQILEKNLDLISNKAKLLKEEIAKKELEIKKIIEIDQKHKYIIHSILVHKGDLRNDIGNYFSYIYDSKINIWYKFNDQDVTKISEEEVMKASFGNSKGEESKIINSSAFCLIYISDKISTQSLSEDFKRDKLKIPLTLKEKIQQKNGLLNSAIEKWDNDEEEERIKEEINKIKLQVDQILTKKIQSKISKKVLSNEKRSGLKNLLNFAIHTNKKILVKKIIVDELLKQYFLNKKDQENSQRVVNNENYNNNNKDNDRNNNNSNEQDVDNEKKMKENNEKKMEIEFEQLHTFKIGEKIIKKQKFIDRVNKDVVGFSTIEIQRQIALLKYNYALYLVYHEQFYSIMENIFKKDYYQSLIELYDLKKRIKTNRELDPNFEFNLFINLCAKKILNKSFNYLETNYQIIDDPNVFQFLKQIEVINILIFQIFYNDNGMNNQKITIEFLLDEVPPKENILFKNSKQKLMHVLSLFMKTENSIVIQEITSLIDLLNNEQQILQYKIPRPNLDKYCGINEPLYKNFSSKYNLILKKCQI
ncbi:specific protease [Anaeramoeba flamelloides]|uniref:Specific protease n=1 Tax=Anaeramoeba flamelloides TaxID=1746091 RepID=A0ABQ8YPL4_9EUKA|nr:specific protease [Anaeramoeba flamelloides]